MCPVLHATGPTCNRSYIAGPTGKWLLLVLLLNVNVHVGALFINLYFANLNFKPSDLLHMHIHAHLLGTRQAKWHRRACKEAHDGLSSTVDGQRV